MKTWKKLSGAGILCAFLICTFFGYEAFAGDSSVRAQRSQAPSSQGASKGPTTSAKTAPDTRTPPPSHAPTLVPPPPPPPPPPPSPDLTPDPRQHPVDLPHVVPPPGMTMCTFINANGDLMAIIVPVGSTCHLNSNGSVTVTFPCAIPPCPTFTIPKDTIGGVFYTNDLNPVIIVPYIGSTVTAVPDYFPSGAYSVIFPDGRVYMLPMPGHFWFFPPRPLPLMTPVQNPSSFTRICTFTNAQGVVIALIVPVGARCTPNADGSITVVLPDGERYTIPSDASSGIFVTDHGWHIIAVPYYGSTITDWGIFGYYINLPDGSSFMDTWHEQTPPEQGNTPPLPSGLSRSGSFGYWNTYNRGAGHIRIRSPWFQALGGSGIQLLYVDATHVKVVFPDGSFMYMDRPLVPGAYSYTSPSGTTYHFAIILQGSTVTSLGNGWYHVEPPPGYSGSFDFQYP